MAESTSPAQSTSPRPAAQPDNRTEEQKAADKAAQKAREEGERRAKFTTDIVNQILEETKDYPESDRNTLVREIADKIRSVRVVAAASELRPARSHVMEAEDKHAPFTTPPVGPGEVPSRNIMAQQDHLAGKEAKK